MKKKSIVFALLVGFIGILGPMDVAVFADDDSQSGGSSEQDPTNPPESNPSDNGEGGTSGDNSTTNPSQSSNDNSVEGFGGNSTARPTTSTSTNTTRPTTVLDETDPVTASPIHSRLGVDRVDTDISEDDMSDTEGITPVEASEMSIEETVDDSQIDNDTVIPQYSNYEKRNWVLLITSMFASLGVVVLAIFASIFMGRINAQTNHQPATK